MRHILTLLLLTACVKGVDDEHGPVNDSAGVQPATSMAAVGADSGAIASDSDPVRFDATGRPIVPTVLSGDCEGEDCEYAFPAAVCRPVDLRAAPTESAPVIGHLASRDTVQVKRDLHVKTVGVVVLKKTFVLDRDIGDIEEPTPQPRSDTVRFAQGDSIYLIRYLSLGMWRWAHRGRQHDSHEFWSALPGRDQRPERNDSSLAAARSEPIREDWWHVRSGRGAEGWWLGSGHDDLVSTSDRVRRHDDCPRG
jgi:hypothetical protein